MFEKETNTTKIRKKLLLDQEDKTETRKFQGNQLVINEIEKLKKFFGGRRTRLTKMMRSGNSHSKIQTSIISFVFLRNTF